MTIYCHVVPTLKMNAALLLHSPVLRVAREIFGSKEDEVGRQYRVLRKEEFCVRTSHLLSLGCGWWILPLDMEGSCQHIE